MANSRTVIGHLMALGAILIYSVNTNFMKVMIPEWIKPEGLVLLRCSASVLGFWLADLWMRPQAAQKTKRKDILMMLAIGSLGMGTNLLLYVRGLSMTGPADAFVIRTMQPIIIILLTLVFLHGKFSKYQAIGIFFGLAGTIYVSVSPHEGSVHDSFSGDMVVFLSSVVYALYLVLIKPYTARYNPVFVMKWMSLGAFVLCIPFGAKQLVEAPLFDGLAETHVWLQLAYILLFATLIGYFLNLKALTYISPFTESAYIYLLPVTGTAISILMGLQKFSWHDPVALLLIATGFILINTQDTRNPIASWRRLFHPGRRKVPSPGDSHNSEKNETAL